MYVLPWRTVYALTLVFLYKFKHKNNPLVSAETVRHSSTCIIHYVLPAVLYLYWKKNTHTEWPFEVTHYFQEIS